MNKETLTVYTDKDSTIRYFNADGHYINGKLHNPDGPAVAWASGHEEHWFNGERHNANGPAVIYANGHKEYCINDKLLTEAEFKTWQAQQSAPLHNTTATIDGIEYTLTAK